MDGHFINIFCKSSSDVLMYCSKSLGFNTNIILFFPLPSFLRRVLYCCVKIWNKSKERHGIKTDHFNLLVRSSEDCWILYLLIKCYFQTVTWERGSIKKTRVTFNPSEHPMIYWDPPVTSRLSSVLTSFVQHKWGLSPFVWELFAENVNTTLLPWERYPIPSLSDSRTEVFLLKRTNWKSRSS